MKFGILTDKFKLKKFQSLYFVFEYWFRDIYPSPDNKILDWSKFKAFADDKINAGEKLKTVYGRVEDIVRKGENVGYQYFLLFSQCFQKSFLLGVVESLDCMVKSQGLN